jgi:hypothetical protein
MPGTHLPTARRLGVCGLGVIVVTPASNLPYM